jgi:BNR repeat-like domain
MKQYLQGLALLLCATASCLADRGIAAEFAVPGISAQQPQMAAGPDGTLYLVYGAGQTIFCAASRDGGKSFDTPAALETGGLLMLGRHRGPRVAATKDAVTITAIIGKRGRGQDGDLLAWRSTDHGKTWGQPVVLNHEKDSAREGLHGFAGGPGNLLFAVWLDLRQDKSSGTKLYGTVSKDGGKSWEKDRLVYASPQGTICQCCHPSVTIDAKGVLHVMWRNALDGSRDLYHAASNDGGKTFAPAGKLGRGTWPLNACPMDGGEMTIAGDGQIDSVWRRQEDIFVASASEEEKVLGKGRNPVIAYGKAGRYVAWEDAESKGAVLHRPGAAKPVTLGTQSQFVDLASTSSGQVAAAWEETRGDYRVVRVQVLD